LSAANTTKWIGIGLLGLPLYGALTFFSSLDPQSDPNTDYEAWAHYVSTNYYVLKHLFASILGIVFALFGTIALGAYLSRSRAGRLGLVAVVITVFDYALFLTIGGVSTFAAPGEGQAYVAGDEEFAQIAATGFAVTAQTATNLTAVLRAPVSGQCAPGSSGLALKDAAQVGGGPLGSRGRADVAAGSGDRNVLYG